MNEKIDKQISVIVDLEYRQYKFEEMLQEAIIEKQIAISKESDINIKSNQNQRELSEAYRILKEIITNGFDK